MPLADVSATMPLAAEYANNGYVVLHEALDDHGIEGLRRLLAGQIDELATWLFDKDRVASTYASAPFARRLALLAAESGIDLRKWNVDIFSEGIHQIVVSPALVESLVEILGPEVTFHGDFQVTAKLPGSERTAFPWHQDTWYYGEESRHLHVVTAWAPLVPATEANGCLWVLPCSHRWGLLPAERPRGADNVRTLVDVESRAEPVALLLEPGDVVLMSNQTFHSSQINNTEHVRWSLDLGFSATGGSAGPPVVADGPPSSHLEVAASRGYIWDQLARYHRTPMVLAGSRGPDSWSVWRDRHREDVKGAGLEDQTSR